jgi:predicted RNA-binding Zn ribbon-like protein
MAMHRYELVGGDPALDFLNTIHDYTEEPRRDYLVSFDAALRWGVGAGLLTTAESRRAAPLDDGAELSRLIELRSVLQRVSRATIGGRAPSSTDLGALASMAAEAAEVSRFHRGGSGVLHRTIGVDDAGAAVLRLRIVDAAVTLLTSERALRAKSCPACGWFFVDATKNRSRRWCSMSTCGASAKSRRYYRKSRARRSRG